MQGQGGEVATWDVLGCHYYDMIHSLKLTWPLKIGHPKRKSDLPTIDFQGQAVSFREGSSPNSVFNTWGSYGSSPNSVFNTWGSYGSSKRPGG